MRTPGSNSLCHERFRGDTDVGRFRIGISGGIGDTGPICSPSQASRSGTIKCAKYYRSGCYWFPHAVTQSKAYQPLRGPSNLQPAEIRSCSTSHTMQHRFTRMPWHLDGSMKNIHESCCCTISGAMHARSSRCEELTSYARVSDQLAGTSVYPSILC